MHAMNTRASVVIVYHIAFCDVNLCLYYNSSCIQPAKFELPNGSFTQNALWYQLPSKRKNCLLAFVYISVVTEDSII